jgi:predicted secreted protein
MNFILFFATVFLTLFVNSAAIAAGCSESASPKVQFNANASQLAENDSMRATLFVEVQDRTANGASAQVTRTANEVLRILKKDPNVRVRTGAYRTYPVSDSGTIKTWRARSELIIEGDQIDRVSDAISAVSGKMQLAGVEFFPSVALRKQIEDALVDQAIKAFLDKAQRIAKSFGALRFEICEVRVNDQTEAPPPRPLMRAMAAEAVAAAPDFGGGTTRVNVTVDGTIVLRP